MLSLVTPSCVCNIHKPHLLLTYELIRSLIFYNLLGVACDLPAAHHLCGFMACTASTGCSRCDVTFPSKNPKKKKKKKKKNSNNNNSDNSKKMRVCFGHYGLNIDNRQKYPRRTMARHRRAAARWQNSNNPSQAAAHSKETGVRYTIFLRLPYFNVIRSPISRAR